MQLDNVSFSYNDKPIFTQFSLAFAPHGITAVLGDSGVGKTTLLHLLAGLCLPTEGSVQSGRVSYLFQQPRLLPALSVLRNLTVLPDITPQAAQYWLQAVGLGDSLSLYPHQLSGGMAQRVALARAFAASNDILLMDEPFKGLDLALQNKLHQVFLQLWRERTPTTVLVTHDIDEAVALAQRVVVLRGNPATIVADCLVSPSCLTQPTSTNPGQQASDNAEQWVSNDIDQQVSDSAEQRVLSTLEHGGASSNAASAKQGTSPAQDHCGAGEIGCFHAVGGHNGGGALGAGASVPATPIQGTPDEIRRIVRQALLQ